ncbi:MAG: hypothetical protein JJU48_01855 [Methylophaga sp.]|nr:hypothetical protein [Methylophaga sp.]
MMKRILPFLLLPLSTSLLAAENYFECMQAATQQGVVYDTELPLAIYCTTQHFDTAPIAFQARAMELNIEDMKKNDPTFRAYYDTVRRNSTLDIYTDAQVIELYLDKREVNKD